ncbi:MAG: hypothetical protein KDC54_18980 [Lewinella sp.]|nr:hypothetical protein [Lewinella sp.]
MRHIFSGLVLFLTLSSLLPAQNDLSSPLLRDTWQALAVNPAWQPKGILVGLPGMYSDLYITNITYNDLIRKENGQTIVDIDQAISRLGDQNTLRERLDVETIGIALRLGPVGVNLGHRLRFIGQIDYPKTLPQLIWQGNAQFVGQTIGFGPAVDVTAYHELSLGGNIGLGEHLQVGARVKLLSGAGNAHTERNDLQLTTDENAYELTLDADLRVNTSQSINYDSFRDVSTDFNFGDFSLSGILGKNTGLAFDLGASARFGRLQVAVSALDLGASINWKDDPRNYTLEGQYDYTGLDLAQHVLEEEGELNSVIDTLLDIYEPTETAESYTTEINAKYYLNGAFDVTSRWQAGLIFFAEQAPDEWQTALALTSSYQFPMGLRLGGFYGLRRERFDNIGLNAVYSLGPVRLIAATDNVITVFRPKDAHQANFRLGINLFFGKSTQEEMEEERPSFF